MLYLTTRDRFDTFTTPHALQEDRAMNGGLYYPYRLPAMEDLQLQELGEKGFSSTVAYLLNQFFGTKLSAWDIEFAIGRYPVKLVASKHRIIMAELWHNQDSEYDHIVRVLTEQLLPAGSKQTSWVRIGIRIAVLFGIYGELRHTGAADAQTQMDVAVMAGNFSTPMALHYARQMGLPIANIICGCNENSALWDLLHIGEVKTDTPIVHTATPLADFSLSAETERLICATLGVQEAKRFGSICQEGEVYSLTDPEREALRKGMFAAVVSSKRLNDVIPSVFRTNGYILGPYSALAYGALLDYRAKTGENRPVLLLADRCPTLDADAVSAAMQMDVSQWENMLRRN